MGIGQYNFKQKYIDASHRNDHGWGYRFGAGMQYNINEQWAARAIFRYIHTDKINSYDHINEYSFGVRYTFWNKKSSGSEGLKLPEDQSELNNIVSRLFQFR